jgi:hypothetical protein
MGVQHPAPSDKSITTGVSSQGEASATRPRIASPWERRAELGTTE